MPDVSGITALDVAIGLAFLYFVLSVACSAATEAIAGALKLRALELEKGIRQILGGADVASQFYSSPRVHALVKKGHRGRERPPSYIPARVFALTLLDTVAPPGDGVESADLIRRAESSVEGMEDSTVKAMLQDALLDAKEGVKEFRESLERSFDEVMDRVSGWYKRRAQLILAGVAVVLVAATNADTFAIGERLWKDEAVRAAVVAAAQDQKNATACEDRDDQTVLPADRAAECVDRVEELGMPLGWTDDTTPDKLWDWQTPAKGLGLLITALMLTLGAPFWFDVLGKLSRLRATGNREGTAKNERAAVDRDDRS